MAEICPFAPGGGDERDGYYPSSHKTPCGCLWNAVNAVRAAFPIRGADFRPTVPLDAVTRCHQRWAIGGSEGRGCPLKPHVASGRFIGVNAALIRNARPAHCQSPLRASGGAGGRRRCSRRIRLGVEHDQNGLRGMMALVLFAGSAPSLPHHYDHAPGGLSLLSHQRSFAILSHISSTQQTPS